MADPKQVIKQTIREVINDAYTFVRGCYYVRTVANTTYEELVDAAIERIKGTNGRSAIRPTKLQRIAELKEKISKQVDLAKTIPPQDFVLTEGEQIDESEKANTAE